mmetsp:Transcript_20445/g.54192  ORF Transcript_20445/g.54192 Transcript_20445/m.54192 type:complete len:233 (-) Transcript_20445:932-1630(-)
MWPVPLTTLILPSISISGNCPSPVKMARSASAPSAASPSVESSAGPRRRRRTACSGKPPPRLWWPCRRISSCISSNWVSSCPWNSPSLPVSFLQSSRSSRTAVAKANISTRMRLALSPSAPLAKRSTDTRPRRTGSTFSKTRLTSSGGSCACAKISSSSSANSSLNPTSHSASVSSDSSIQVALSLRPSRVCRLARNCRSSALSRISCGMLDVPKRLSNRSCSLVIPCRKRR